MCCVVFAHLEPQNTRSPFSIQREASPLITKYIVRGRRAGSCLLRFLRRPCTPFKVTVMDDWGSCRDMPGIKQHQPRARAHPAPRRFRGTSRALSLSSEWFWPKWKSTLIPPEGCRRREPTGQPPWCCFDWAGI